jgi:chemotaxis signal transduction protein
MTEDVAKTSRAWLLDFGRGLQAAVGHQEMWQVLISPVLFDVPCTPTYCSEVLVFQDLILPVLDMSSLLEGQKTIPVTSPVVGIAIYQDDPTQPIRYACLHLATTPQSIYVSDEQACDLPAHQPYWEPLAQSCFSIDGRTIPIIDLAYLFSEEFNTKNYK